MSTAFLFLFWLMPRPKLQGWSDPVDNPKTLLTIILATNMERDLPALAHTLSPKRGFLPFESSGCFMRIQQSSRGCIPKRWERFTFSRGRRLG